MVEVTDTNLSNSITSPQKGWDFVAGVAAFCYVLLGPAAAKHFSVVANGILSVPKRLSSVPKRLSSVPNGLPSVPNGPSSVPKWPEIVPRKDDFSSFSIFYSTNLEKNLT